MMAKILIIDDEELTVEMLSTFLRISGHEPLGALDGRQGWSILDYENPQAILLDIQLPDTNGLIMCQEIKSTPDLAHLPIIMISAHAPPKIKEAEAAGASDYLQKPINLKTLQATLERNL
jgi:DNA-binding response OmpR family regulator